MRKKCYILLFMLIASTNLSSCKSNKTKHIKTSQTGNLKTENEAERVRRSIDNEEDKPFWANRGKKQSDEEDYGPTNFDLSTNNIQHLFAYKIDKEPSYWGNRGSHDSSEEVNDYKLPQSNSYAKTKHCPHCKDIRPMSLRYYNDASKDDDPFWGNRGRRGSDEDTSEFSPFWGNRGRRQEDDPFWGTRGRREDLPFWGNRGRGLNLFLNNRALSLGHRSEDDDPFWGNRGRRDEVEPFWGNRGRRDLKDTIKEAISSVEDDIRNLYVAKTYPWKHNTRANTLKHLFDGTPKDRFGYIKKVSGTYSGANTIYDDRIYAEQPHYILVERSSRSSNEDDPYIISRGKKHLGSFWAKADRERRNAFEDIFKSVKTDPYFIARGKKDELKVSNSTVTYEDFFRTRELICATIDLMRNKSKDESNKRSIDDSDRGRRAVLQKLAAQLQSDPYFVSRGKKDSDNDDSNIMQFINDLSELCY